jgi:beta-carotene hydroxylase
VIAGKKQPLLEPNDHLQKPTIHELGTDLLDLSVAKLFITLFTPFVFLALYIVFAFRGYWIPAVLCAMALSFTTYGSTSHDLVHRNLKISKTMNEFLLSVIELICFRSGHAYKISHLYHHKRYPHEDDVEGAASRMTLLRSLVEGVIFQPKLYGWALKNFKHQKELYIILAEGIAVVLLALFCLFSVSYTLAGVVYLGLMIMGSWIIPLVTSYAVHTPEGNTELHQTRLFRGKFFSWIAFDHLYHLEHHLYPMVPHKNWPVLAKRLDPYFTKHKLHPLTFDLKNSGKIFPKKNDGQKNTA